jgi:hypothetical protein
MNQKSSLREDLKSVSWMLTGNTRLAIVGWRRRGACRDGWSASHLGRDIIDGH